MMTHINPQHTQTQIFLLQVINVIFLYFIMNKLSLYVFGSTTELFNKFMLSGEGITCFQILIVHITYLLFKRNIYFFYIFIYIDILDDYRFLE